MNNETLYKIASFQLSQTKNGKEMWRIGMHELDKPESVLTGIIWQEDIPRFDGTKFKAGNVIKFLGQDYNSNYNSTVIKNVTVVKEALAGLPEHIADTYLKNIKAVLSYTTEKYPEGTPLHLLAKEIETFIDSEKFITTPAAEKYHHNYIGGLVKHTHEVLEICSQLATMFPIEKSDELMLAAILHDIGKCLEYTTNISLGTATTDSDFIHNQFSHILWGTQIAQSVGAFDVARMVASHHGKLEWGALIEPETIEEKILHLADMLSAAAGITTMDKLEALVEELMSPATEVDTDIQLEDKKEEESDACENDSNIL